MSRRLNYSGLVIAAIGFFLTRFTVTLALYEDPVSFYLAGVVPLVLGLGLAAFGVALVVADVESSLVRTTALWCVVGATTMLFLVALTLLGSAGGTVPDAEMIRSQVYLANFLIGGSVGGTLTGLYAARNRRQRAELHQHANRLEVLNRLLRHEVLNAVAVIRGYAGLDGSADAQRIIEARSDEIQRTIEEVKYVARSARAETWGGSVDVTACLDAGVAAVRERHPGATISVTAPPSLRVQATDRLEQVFGHLVENAVVHAGEETPRVDVDVMAHSNTVRISVRDEGPGLPESQRELLETGAIDDFDNPNVGFGLNIVRLLVESYRGEIETRVDESGTTVTLVLRRVVPGEGGGGATLPTRVGSVRPALPRLLVTLVAAVVAGLLYGVVAEALGGNVAGIGVFYGFQNPVVGWITHEFHSIVFGFVFSGLVAVAPARLREHLWGFVAIGAGWGTFLWVVAAGIVSPIWLRLLGIPAPLPNITPTLLVTHLVWGVSLAVLTAWGYEALTPWLARVTERVRVGSGWLRA